jgi:phage tail-like protein
MKDTFDAASGTGEVTPDLYRTFDIIQLNRKGEEVERWTIYDAYCSQYGAGDWDNDASEVALEQVVIELDRWERKAA